MTITTAEHLLSRTQKAFTYEDQNGKIHFLLVNARAKASLAKYKWNMLLAEQRGLFPRKP